MFSHQNCNESPSFLRLGCNEIFQSSLCVILRSEDRRSMRVTRRHPGSCFTLFVSKIGSSHQEQKQKQAKYLSAGTGQNRSCGNGQVRQKCMRYIVLMVHDGKTSRRKREREMFTGLSALAYIITYKVAESRRDKN